VQQRKVDGGGQDLGLGLPLHAMERIHAVEQVDHRLPASPDLHNQSPPPTTDISWPV
jgi:hypothetical protein